MMPRWQRAYAIATCSLIGAALAYALCDWSQWPRLTYLPLTETWTMRPPGNAIAITYPGNIAWGLGGAACGALIGSAVVAVFHKSLPERALQLLGAWSITAILLAGTYFTWTVWPW
jgi:hypothetical protein